MQRNVAKIVENLLWEPKNVKCVERFVFVCPLNVYQ